MSGSWRDTDEDAPALVSVLVSRALPGGLFATTIVLVDRTCLGVKNAHTMPRLTLDEVHEMVERLEEAHPEGVEEVSPLEAQSVIFNALDYGASLGFAPHSDFMPGYVGPRPDVLLDTPLARPSKPVFVPGPDDNVTRVLSILRAKVGTAFSLGTLSGGMEVGALTGFDATSP
jgi:hypothetical protein